MSFTELFNMSISVQRDATIYSFIIFLQTALRVSDDILIHHQEHTQTVITTSGTGRTLFSTVRWHGGVGTTIPTPPPQRMIANTVLPVPDVVITVWVCSWWCMRISTETRRAVYRNVVKVYIVASRWAIIDIGLRCTEPWTKKNCFTVKDLQHRIRSKWNSAVPSHSNTPHFDIRHSWAFILLFTLRWMNATLRIQIYKA